MSIGNGSGLRSVDTPAVMNRRFTFFREFGFIGIDQSFYIGVILEFLREGKGSNYERISLLKLLKGLLDILLRFLPLSLFSLRCVYRSQLMLEPPEIVFQGAFRCYIIKSCLFV